MFIPAAQWPPIWKQLQEHRSWDEAASSWRCVTQPACLCSTKAWEAHLAESPGQALTSGPDCWLLRFFSVPSVVKWAQAADTCALCLNTCCCSLTWVKALGRQLVAKGALQLELLPIRAHLAHQAPSSAFESGLCHHARYHNHLAQRSAMLVTILQHALHTRAKTQ